MQVCFVCAVCGLLGTCLLIFIAYRFFLPSSSKVEGEYQEDQVEYKEHKVNSKQATMSTWKVSDTGSIPATVLRNVDAVMVEEKNATFNVDGHVSYTSNICCQKMIFFMLYLEQVKITVSSTTN